MSEELSEEISEVILDQLASERRVSTGELAALKLALQKRKSKDIAKSLDISESAARKRLGEVYRKFDIKGSGPGKLASLEQKLIDQASDPAGRYAAVGQSGTPLFDPSFAAIAANVDRKSAIVQPGTRYHWGEVPKVGMFQGRDREIQSLTQWIVEPAQSPKLLAICGIGGIGKTALSLKLVEEVGQRFQQVVWFPVDGDRTPEDFLRSLLIVLQANASSKISLRRSSVAISPLERSKAENNQDTSSIKAREAAIAHSYTKKNPPDSESVARLIRQLILHLSQQLCLVVLDGFEAVFKAEPSSAIASKDGPESTAENRRAPTFNVTRQQQASAYRKGFEAYGAILEAIEEAARFQAKDAVGQSASGSAHPSSCVIITSREKPREFLSTASDLTNAIKLYPLYGLTNPDAIGLTDQFCLRGTEVNYRELVRRYSGHPMALMLAASTIQDVFSGSIANFLDQEISVFDGLRSVLKAQFKRLPAVEKEAMYWLAINQRPCQLEALKTDIVSRDCKANLLYILHSLERRSLIEVAQPGGFSGVQYSLHPIVLEYVLDRFVREMFCDLVRGDLTLFNSYAVLQADAEDEIRSRQTELIVNPILDRLRNHFKSLTVVNSRLSDRLETFRSEYPYRLGYAGGNFINLLVQLCASDLSKRDFSELAIWQAYLPGVLLSDSKFNACQLDRSVFTETLSDVLAIAFSQTEDRSKDRSTINQSVPLMVAGDANGAVHLWQAQTSQGIQAGSIARSSNEKLGQWLAHSGWVRSLCFVPHTDFLITGGDDSKIKLWRLQSSPQSGATIAELIWAKTARDWVRAIAVSPDGALVAIGGDDKVTLRHIRDGRQVGTIGSSYVQTLAFSPDGKWLAGGGDAIVRLWAVSDIDKVLDMDKGSNIDRATSRTSTEIQPAQLLEGHQDLVNALCFSPDSTRIVTGGSDRSIIVWAIGLDLGQVSYKRLYTFDRLGDRVRTLSISPDGRFLASGGDDACVRLWDFETFEPIANRSTHRSRLWSVAFQQQESRLLLSTGGDRQRLTLWQIESGVGQKETKTGASVRMRPLKTYRGYTRGIRAMAYLGDRRIIGGGDSGDLMVWDAQSGDRTAALSLHQGRIWSVAVDPQKKRIASASDDYTVRLWSAHSGQCLTMLAGHSSWVRTVSFSHHGRYLASAGDDCTIRIWNTVSGLCTKVLDRSERWIRSIAFDPANGRYLISGGNAQTVRRWDRKENTYEELAHHEHRICSVAYSRDGELIASGSDDTTVIVWNAKKKEKIHQFRQSHLGIKSVSFSPNGRYLAAGGDDQIVYVWDLTLTDPDRRCLKLRPYDYTGLAGGIRSVVFSPDSQFVISGGLDEMIRQGALSQMEKLEDLDEGVLEPLIERDRPYENLEIANVTGLSDLQIANLLSLGAVNRKQSLLP